MGFSCAVDGSKAALARPSDAWKPLTAATLVVAVALDGVGFFAVSNLLSPGDDAGMITSLASRIVVVAIDGAWLFIAPLLAIAIVQQVLPLLGEKIFFDALVVKSESSEGDTEGGSGSGSCRAARVRQLEESGGLGLRGLGVAASRAQSLAGLGVVAIPAGLSLSIIPVVGPIAAAALATCVAAYTLAWELLDPYFDKAELGFEQQEKVVWGNRVALTAFAFPFAAALAVPLVGPLSVAVAQGAAAELVWRVLEIDPHDE